MTEPLLTAVQVAELLAVPKTLGVVDEQAWRDLDGSSRPSRGALSPGGHRTMDRTPDIVATDGHSVLTGLTARILACRGSARSTGS